MKQKIEIEIDVPEGMEIVRTTEHNSISIFSDKMSVNMLVYLRDIEPPLELESRCFEQPECCFNVYAMEHEIDIAKRIRLSKREVRDLIKILSYYLQHGTLPKVTVKEVDGSIL